MIFRLATVFLTVSIVAQVHAADKVMLEPQLAREAAAWNAFKLSGTKVQKQDRWRKACDDFQDEFGKFSVRIDAFLTDVTYFETSQLAHVKYRSVSSSAFKNQVITPSSPRLSLQCSPEQALKLRVGDRVKIFADVVFLREDQIEYPNTLVAMYQVYAHRGYVGDSYSLSGRLFASTYTAEIGKLKLNYKAVPEEK